MATKKPHLLDELIDDPAWRALLEDPYSVSDEEIDLLVERIRRAREEWLANERASRRRSRVNLDEEPTS